jgi:hypothetical protein
MFMTVNKPKYNWDKSKLSVVYSSAEKFYFRNLDTMNTLSIELEDFKQNILEKILSVSGYKTNSMNLYKDNDHSIHCFTWFLCKQYLSTQLSNNKKRKAKNFSVEYLEDLLSEEDNRSFEDLLSTKNIDDFVFMELIDKVPNLPIVRGSICTYKTFFLHLINLTLDEISLIYSIEKATLVKAQKELESFIKGVYE